MYFPENIEPILAHAYLPNTLRAQDCLLMFVYLVSSRWFVLVDFQKDIHID
jgi:hypothetical protein